jgi:Protein of unknown function (DUF3780)
MNKKKAQGFGYSPEEGTHHFIAEIRKEGPVFLYQHINGLSRHVATFTRNQWDEIAQPVAAVFNIVLGQQGYVYGRWKVGEIPLRDTMGKELLLLARAIEDADLDRIPRILDYWRGLHPCERWWLCTQSNAVHEGPHDERKGWRMAIKYALGAIED